MDVEHVLIRAGLIMWALFLAFMIFVFVPIHLSNEIKCYDLGYPKVETTITLRGYCINIDGAVTGTVFRLEEK